MIINHSFQSIGEYVVPVTILVPESPDCDGIPLFPLVHRGHASTLFFPVTVNDESAPAVGLFPHSHCFIKRQVVLAFGVQRVIDASHAVRMAPINQPIHPLLLETTHQGLWGSFVLHSNGVSRPELNCVPLESEDVLGCTLQLNRSAAGCPLSCVPVGLEEFGKSSFLLLMGRDVGNEREDGSKANLRLILVVLGSLEEVVAISGEAALVGSRAIRALGDITLLSTPVGVVGSAQEVSHMLGVPCTAIQCLRHLHREELRGL
jgi:hypothetical protein